MEHAKWERLARGIAFGTIFCLAYLAAWFHSLDQWFLPAGVRVAALLLLPYRYWPYLIAADCVGLLLLRVPGASGDRLLWAYASSALLPVMLSLALAGLRSRFRTLQDQAKWIPLIAACMAVWGSVSNVALNGLLDGPPSAMTLEFFYRRSVGHFLGILAITLPAMLWLSRNDLSLKPRHFGRDALICVSVIAAIFCTIVLPERVGDYLRIGLMLMMLAPVIFMTMRHGWSGAAVGVTAACFAVAKTLYALDVEGAYDAPVFIVQHALVIASCGLLALGYSISCQYATARALGISEKEALQASRTSFCVTERMLREKAQTLEEMHCRIDRERKRIVEYLKAIGDYEGALLLNNEAVEHNSRFGAHIADIYPLKLERHGLNAVLNSQEFIDARGRGAHVLPLLGSNPMRLSVEIQRAAYRCVCSAIDVLSDLQPRAYVIKTRIRKTERHRGIALIVTVREPAQPASTPKAANAAIELTARAKAHGGIVKRRHAHQISLWLPEPCDRLAAGQWVASG